MLGAAVMGMAGKSLLLLLLSFVLSKPAVCF